MALSAPIPPDVIYEILKYIHDDLVTLKLCSVVSEAFYQHTRKFLFTCVTLGQPKLVSSLDRTITRNPQIPAYIRSLNIPYPFKSTLRRIMRILPTLTNVQHLILGVNGPYTMIPDFPGFFPAITAMLKLRNLERLEIYSIEAFPVSLLHVPERLKWLTLDKFWVDAGSIPEASPPPLLHLTTLHIISIISRGAEITKSFIHAPNLRRLMFKYGVNSLRAFIEAGVETLEEVVCYDYSSQSAYPISGIEVLRNLRRLSFVTAGVSNIPYLRWGELPPWVPMRNMLRAGSATQRLEELNIFIKTKQPLTSGYIESLLGSTDIWDELADTTRYPRLKSVTISFDDAGFNLPTSANDIRMEIAQWLPLLHVTGRLHIGLCEKFRLE